VPKLPAIPAIPVNAVTAVTTGSQNLFNAWKDYATTREAETTKRTQIEANRDVALAAIQAQAETLRMLIEGTFAERAKNFDQYFALLDAGFTNGNEQQINAALTLIVEQTKVSPMMQAAQLMNKINDPGNTDVIEI
jgi:hypothetical protein